MNYGHLLLPFALVALHGTSLAAQPSSRGTHIPVCTGKLLSSADTAAEQAALQRYEQGDAAGAKADLVRLADAYPCRAQLQAAAGMALAESGDTTASVPYLQRAHASRPADDAIAFNFAVSLLHRGDAAKAADLFGRIAAHAPQRTDVRLALAEAQMQAKDFSAAASSFAAAHRLQQALSEPTPLDMRMDWALALLSSSQPAAARDVLANAEGLSGSAPAQELLAEAEEKSGTYAEAARHYEAAARLDPSESNTFAFGNELLQHWTFGPAIEIFKFGADRFPSSERMHLGLGIAYFGNGNYSQAVPEFRGMLQRSPSDASAAELLGRSCAALSGEPLPGCDALVQFAESHPGNAMASLYAASSILHQPEETRDLAKAQTLLDNSVNADPKLADAWYERGVLQQTRNDWQGSAASLQHAITLRPAYPEAHYRLSRAYGHLGRRDDANAEVALQQKFAQQEKDEKNKHLQDVITFLTASK